MANSFEIDLKSVQNVEESQLNFAEWDLNELRAVLSSAFVRTSP